MIRGWSQISAWQGILWFKIRLRFNKLLDSTIRLRFNKLHDFFSKHETKTSWVNMIRGWSQIKAWQRMLSFQSSNQNSCSVSNWCFSNRNHPRHVTSLSSAHIAMASTARCMGTMFTAVSQKVSEPRAMIPETNDLFHSHNERTSLLEFCENMFRRM